MNDFERFAAKYREWTDVELLKAMLSGPDSFQPSAYQALVAEARSRGLVSIEEADRLSAQHPEPEPVSRLLSEEEIQAIRAEADALEQKGVRWIVGGVGLTVLSLSGIFGPLQFIFWGAPLYGVSLIWEARSRRAVADEAMESSASGHIG